MEKFLEVLRYCPLFDGIEDRNLMSMLSCLGAEENFFESGETVFFEGDEVNKVGVVLSGAVQIVGVDYDGNRNIVGKVMPSEMFAEAFACAGVKEIPVSVVACEDSHIMLIDCMRIVTTCNNVCDFHNRIILNLMKIMAKKNLNFHRKIEVTSKRTTRGKLLTFLFLEAKQKGKRSFTVPYDRQELADYLGVDRSGLSAEIGKLKKEKIIKCRKNNFELLIKND